MLVKYVLHAFKTRIIVIDCDITDETFSCETDNLGVVDFYRLEKLRNPNLKFVNKETFPFLNNLCTAKNDCNSYDM